MLSVCAKQHQPPVDQHDAMYHDARCTCPYHRHPRCAPACLSPHTTAAPPQASHTLDNRHYALFRLARRQCVWLCAATWLGTAQRHAISQPKVRCLEQCIVLISTCWLYYNFEICPSYGPARLQVHLFLRIVQLTITPVIQQMPSNSMLLSA
jgi:hypothetical protein